MVFLSYLAFRVTVFSFVTLGLAGLTAWLAYSRTKYKLESSWPLFYYVAVVTHLKVFEGGLDPVWVYVGVVMALFLRFEFMGGWILKLFRVTEFVVLGYIFFRCIFLALK